MLCQRPKSLAIIFATTVTAALLVFQPANGAETVSRLIVVRVGDGDAKRTVIALGRPASRSSSVDSKGSIDGLLARELIRQAVLIAARDELQLATRDEVIGDPAVEDPDGVAGEVLSDLRTAPGSSRIDLRRGLADEAKTLLKQTPHFEGAGEAGYLPKLVVFAETLARTEFPAALKSLGVDGSPNAFRPAAPLPANVLERLDRLGFVDNFSAVRDLHEAIRSDGESIERLGALARGYAQLGVLSEFHWNAAHKAFKARALLYAQRLVSREPASPRSLWHRAFVETLVGLTGDARADLLAAKKKAETDNVKDSPTWLPVLDAYLAYDLDKLKGFAGPHARLAALLRMLSVEFPTWTTLALHAARDLVKLDPECYRAHDMMCQVGGVGNLHVATTAGPAVLSERTPEKLAGLKLLPAAVRKVIDADDDLDEPALIDALIRSGAAPDDRGEPSWAALAHLLYETRFVQAFRRLHFMRFSWSVPATDEWATLRPLLSKHPNVPYLDAIADPALPNGPLAAWVGRYDLSNIEITENYVFSTFASIQQAKLLKANEMAFAHNDPVLFDLTRTASLADRATGIIKFRELLALEPRSPLARGVLAEYDWDAVEKQVPAWEKESGNAPVFQIYLGARYSAMKRYAEAKEYLYRYIQEVPDPWAYRLIAYNYKLQGDRVRWKATLDSFLEKVEESGLDHAGVRVEIASDLMDQKRWVEAKPYAEAAAETWAGWAMACAVRCYEGLGDWAHAELWARRTTERYPFPAVSWSDWYRCCRRTGHGDVKAARELAEAQLNDAEAKHSYINPWGPAYFYWSTGSLTKAREYFEAAIRVDPTDSSLLLHLALVVDEAGDIHRRDELLDLLWTTHQGQAPRANQVCRVLRKWLAGGTKRQPDLDFVKRTIERLPPDARWTLELFVGRFLRQHGRPELARPFLERAAAASRVDDWVRVVMGPAPASPASRKRPAARRRPS